MNIIIDSKTDNKKNINIKKYILTVFGGLGVLCSIVGIPLAIASILSAKKWGDFIPIFGWSFFIILILLIIAVLIFYILSYYTLKKNIKSFNLDNLKTNEYLHNFEKHFFGASYTIQDIVLEINNDGSFIKRTSFTFKSETENINKLQFFSKAPSINEQSGSCHTLNADDKHHKDSKVVIKKISINNKECHWELFFSPPLGIGKSINYDYELKGTKGTFYKNQDELKNKGLTHDYYSHKIIYPTEELKIKLIFPFKSKPLELQSDVWIDKGNIQHAKEKQRIRDNGFWGATTDNKGRVCATLHVKHPIHGLNYVIKWIPSK